MKRIMLAFMAFMLLDTPAAHAQVDTVAFNATSAGMTMEEALSGCISDPVLAPSFQNSLYVSYGGLGLVEFAFMLGTAMVGIPAIAIAGDDADISLRMSGNVQLGYARNITGWLWVGGDLGYEHLGIRTSDSGGVTESSVNMTTLMASAKADWFRRNKVAMYSKLSAGILGAFGSEDTSVSPAFHVTLYGIEFGSPQVRGLVELGAGLSATIAAGVRYRF